MVRLDPTGFKKPKNKKESRSLMETLLNEQFKKFGNESKGRKKARKVRSWQLPNISLPGLKAMGRHNDKITKQRITNLKRRIDRKVQRAEEQLQLGRPGRAVKLMIRRKGNIRELNRLK